MNESLKKENYSGAEALISGLSHFASLLKSRQSAMYSVTELVHQIGVTWTSLMKNEKKLTELLGHKEMSELKITRKRYFYLLIDTRAVVGGLLNESKTRKMDVTTILNLAEKALDPKSDCQSVQGDDADLLEECLKRITQWINEKHLATLRQEWRQMGTDLERQKG